MIAENYKRILQIKDECAAKCNRNSDDICLIAVSKTKPVSALWEAYNAGARDFGENKVQELIAKYDELPKDIRWHMIGHLQTNKVKYIIDKVYMIHSVDSLKLATEISRQAQKSNIVSKILVEVNVAGEESKFGCDYEGTKMLINQISALPNIQVCGLMTVAPYVTDAEENRSIFAKLKELSVDIAAENADNVSMECLSMGMSGDYKVAIEEGATYIRVGTSIFGERDYTVKE